jgi:SPX domain protein involved in polyphosphate accumulation
MKYCISADKRRIIEQDIAKYMVLGEFGQSTIHSLYYDTPNFDLIERSLDKPLYKEKLRLRIYGRPCESGPAFVELKKKFKGIVYKRRIRMSLQAAQAFLAGMPYIQACKAYPLPEGEQSAGQFEPKTLQIARELEFTIGRYGNLEPAMIISCERSAYAHPEDENLRLTFDANLQCIYQAQSIFEVLEVPFRAVPVINPTYSVMEVKNAGALPIWLVEVLDNAKAYPQSFSKYGRAYMNLRKDKKRA